MNGKSALVSVIIPNWNGLKFLPRCLESLRRQTVRDIQIILVDNGSTDGSQSYAGSMYPEVQLLQLNRNYGFSEAVNQGIAKARAPYIALLNNDTEADPRWLESCLDTMSKRPDIGFIACQILDFFNRDRLDSAGDIITRAGLPLKRGSDQSADGRFQEPCEVLSASAGAAFYRREAFERVGSFDAGYFMYLEDVDWSLRAALLGIRCFYVPQAKVYHIEGGSDPERAVFLERGETQRRIFHTRERTYWITRNRVRLLVKNYPTTLLIRIAPWILFGFARSALFHLIKTGLFSSYIRGLMRGLSEIPQCMTLRRSIQQNRKLTTTQFAGILFASQQ